MQALALDSFDVQLTIEGSAIPDYRVKQNRESAPSGRGHGEDIT
jgi:hypothetical protein